MTVSQGQAEQVLGGDRTDLQEQGDLVGEELRVGLRCVVVQLGQQLAQPGERGVHRALQGCDLLELGVSQEERRGLEHAF